MGKLRENRAKRRLQRGENVTVVSGFESPNVIDLLGPSGVDGIWIEGEHGHVDFADIPNLTRACDLWGMTSVVRINQNNPGLIYRTFDVGAQGVVVPHVNTAEEARAVVDAAKFHPIGHRGMYVSRQGYGCDDYFMQANDETMVIVLIEDIVAVENLSDILKVDHIDVFFVASYDLGQSMGIMNGNMHPEVRSVERQALKQIVASGRVAGATVLDGQPAEYMELGVRFLASLGSAGLTAYTREFLGRVHDAAGS